MEVSVSDGGVEDELDQEGGVVDGQESVGVLAQPGQDPAHPVLVVFVAVVSRLGREDCPGLQEIKVDRMISEHSSILSYFVKRFGLNIV